MHLSLESEYFLTNLRFSLQLQNAFQIVRFGKIELILKKGKQ